MQFIESHLLRDVSILRFVIPHGAAPYQILGEAGK